MALRPGQLKTTRNYLNTMPVAHRDHAENRSTSSEGTHPAMTTALSVNNPHGHSFTALQTDLDAKNKGEMGFRVFTGFLSLSI